VGPSNHRTSGGIAANGSAIAKNAMKQIIETIRSLLKNRSSLAVFAGLYALLLATLYGFIATREAKVWQILLTLLFAACAPVIFFLLQATIINSARTGKIDWYQSLRDSCKLALVALPLIFVAFGIAYLLRRWQAHFPAPRVPSFVPNPPPPPQPTHWPTVLFATARALVFAVALPLVMIQLWVDLGKQNLLMFFRSGVRPVLRSLGQSLSRAFSSQAVLTWSLGLIVFALIPYVLLFVRVPLGGTWREIAVFSARLILVFVFTLFGWVITLSTFAKHGDSPALPSPSPAEGEPIPLGSATSEPPAAAGGPVQPAPS
jgi:hypothetical protein